MTKRILTGLKPTGDLHVGNYFGAVKPLVDLQEKEGEIFLFVADLHALTGLASAQTCGKEQMQKHTDSFIKAYVALGIDPDNVVLYRQSDFPQVTELAWIFSCMVKMPFLTMAHAYKDAKEKGESPSVGTFLYPALMAADILLPGAAVVPVGKDQVQHLEVAREFARRFNHLVGKQYFADPEELVSEHTMVVPGIDGEKMSKSKQNTIPIFGPEQGIRDRIQRVVTDSTAVGEPIDPSQSLLCSYLQLFMSPESYATVAERCKAGSVSYRELKELCAEEYLAYFADARARYEAIATDDQFVENLLKKKRERINTLFVERMREIHNLLGLVST